MYLLRDMFKGVKIRRKKLQMQLELIMKLEEEVMFLMSGVLPKGGVK